MFMGQSPRERRQRYGLRSGSIVLAFFVLTGCSPPASDVANSDYSVGMPDGDPGRLTDSSISPPRLHDLDRTTLVQNRGSVEIVPTPDPDAGSGGGAEIVPTPKGVPSKGSDAGDAFPGADGPEDYRKWDAPAVALVVTGNQHGYIEPCGCTGLDRQKGGVARRYTFMQQLKQKGWTLIPIDAGNQVRRFGRQAEVKLQQTAKALELMDYKAIGFGPEDLQLGVGELLAVAAGDGDDESMYVSANVVLIDPSLMSQARVVESGEMKIGITSVLDPNSLEAPVGDEIVIEPIVESTKNALAKLKEGSAEFKVLMYFGTEEAGRNLVREVGGYDLLVVSGGYGEPTYQAESIDGSRTRMIVTGDKGMYAGIVGLFPSGKKKLRYARVPLTHEFEDAPEMRQLMSEYQDQLRDIGLGGLGLLPPIPHSSGERFVGTAKCGECHTTAFDIWEGTPHAIATDDIVRPPKERGDVARHFDPECISCHATGWNPQEYYPYLSGYLSLEDTNHLTGNGCENCHGPGSAHVAAEEDEGTDADVLEEHRLAMRLPLEKAREACLKCHDLDNSPDFHEEDAFEDIYWPEVEHYGTD